MKLIHVAVKTLYGKKDKKVYFHPPNMSGDTVDSVVYAMLQSRNYKTSKFSD